MTPAALMPRGKRAISFDRTGDKIFNSDIIVHTCELPIYIRWRRKKKQTDYREKKKKERGRFARFNRGSISRNDILLARHKETMPVVVRDR